jgi:hypothetical protein
MSKQFDNISRFLTSFDTTSWAKFLGIQTDQAELCNADLSTVTSQADAILLLGEKKKKAAHVEIQASFDATIGIRIVLYYALGFKSLGKPMRSYLILLRPQADHSCINGIVEHVDEDDGSTILLFHYNVIRVWKLKAEDLIESGLGVMPLAFIADIDRTQLPRLVRRAQQRLAREAKPGIVGEIWTSIDILMGLKCERPFVDELLKGARAMKESVTYQGILEEGEAIGKIAGKRDSLLTLGTKLFGKPDRKTQAALKAIDSADELDGLIVRSVNVSSWKELLGR